MNQECICAIATGSGLGGVAIVRISGDESEKVLRGAFQAAQKHCPYESHKMYYGRAVDAAGEMIDEAMAVLMRAPRSYTRENVAEIHCHGGYLTAQAVMKACIAAGARAAEPGEFTKRAFLNGRIDLAEAEAVMALIGAKSESARRASLRQLQGGVSGFIREIRSEIIEMLSALEAATDYPEEIDESEARVDLVTEIGRIARKIDEHADEKRARLIKDGLSVVLAGRPNVGKSSLLNALIGQERAIVTDIPGTTRDVLTEQLTVNGIPVQISDTAGLRVTQDAVEKIGVARADDARRTADVIFVMLDATRAPEEEDIHLLSEVDERYMVLVNKTDEAVVLNTESVRRMTNAPVLEISCRTGENIGLVLDEIARRAGSGREEAGSLTIERHIRAAARAREELMRAKIAVEAGMPSDMAAVDIRSALDILGEITGETLGEQVIDRIFQKFCVGK